MQKLEHKWLVTMAIVIVALLCPQWAQAQFSGSGSGTENDPYLIFNPIQLNEVRNFLNDQNVWFKMMYDIDLGQWLADNNPTQGWQPIGTESSKFKGHFLGNGHKITGLYINRPSTNYLGLFGSTDNATISDLSIENLSMNGTDYVGGFVGNANNTTFTSCSIDGGSIIGANRIGGISGNTSSSTTTITDCSIDVQVTATGNYSSLCVGYSSDKITITNFKGNGQVDGLDYVGGIIGRGSIKIISSSVYGKVTGNNYIGGVAGYGGYTISSSNFVGEVIASGDYVGGLAGYFSSGIGINDSYVIADVIGKSYTGGLVGYTYSSVNSTIKNSYFNGNITGTTNVGGILGYSTPTSGFNTIVEKNYCYGHVTGTDNVGGIAGYCYAIIESNVSVMETINATQSNVGRIYGFYKSGTIGECGTASENKGLATAIVTLNGLQQELPDNKQHGTNASNATLKLRATYQGIGWDFSDWCILETESYPYKSNQCAPPVINEMVAGATVVSGKSINGGTVYLTIGDTEYSAQTNANVWSINVPPLQAGDVVKAYAVNDELEQSYYSKRMVNFKGKGTEAEPYEIYTASDLNNINSYYYYKLMNNIDLTDWIEANNPTEGWVPAGLYGGGSIRQLDGCGHKVTGLWSNTTTDFYGLIAGTQDATICNLNVYTAEGKSLKGGNNTGILVGKAINTTFRNVAVNGDVQGGNYVGGIAGYCDGNIYTNCRINGSVTGNDYVGGLASNSSGSITASYADATVTGNNFVGGLVGQSTGTISESYTSGMVSATNNRACYAGGITGVNSGSINDCYSSAHVNSGVVDGSVASGELQQYAGGIAGYSYGSITRCFASGNLFAVKFGAGVVGYNDGENAVTSHCFAINDHVDVSNETGIALRLIGGIKNNAPTPDANNYALKTMVVSVNNVTQVIYDDLLHGFSRTLAELKQGATYSSNGWDMDNVWDIDESNGFPFLRACATSNTPVATALNIEDNVTIFKGDSYPIEVNVIPNTASTNLLWSSSDPNVVSVSEQGVVFGVEAGSATITASTIDGSNLSATCVVTVRDHAVPATGIILNRQAVTMTIGQTVPLEATVLPDNADNKNVIWNSIDATVATVNNQGIVTAMRAGTTQIIATTADGTNLSAVCNVTVIDAAGNSLDADALTLHNGDEVQFVVRMNNEATITAVQADIYLPDGVNIATEDGDYLIDLVPARMGSNHVVSTNVLPNGAIRLFITSATSKPFKDNEGDLFILNLIVEMDAVAGNYSLDFRNVILSDVNAQTYYAPDLNVPVTIKDFILGDVNIDGTVNVSDYVATANYILELNPYPFVFAAADVDGNLTINVSDLVGVANIALNFLGAPVINYAPAQDYDGLGRMALAANCSNIAPGRYVVTLDLNNSSAITAFQMDINLPMGMKLVNANLSNRASSSHTLEMAELANGTYRLLGSSMMSKAFAGNEGSLLTLEIEGAATGNAVIDGIMLAEPNTFLHKHDAMMLTFDASGVSEMCSDVRIYTENGMVVVESPVANKVQFILPNGMSVERDVKAGRNVYNTGLNGVVIVKVSDQVKKFKL